MEDTDQEQGGTYVGGVRDTQEPDSTEACRNVGKEQAELQKISWDLDSWSEVGVLELLCLHAVPGVPPMMMPRASLWYAYATVWERRAKYRDHIVYCV